MPAYTIHLTKYEDCILMTLMTPQHGYQFSYTQPLIWSVKLTGWWQFIAAIEVKPEEWK